MVSLFIHNLPDYNFLRWHLPFRFWTDFFLLILALFLDWINNRLVLTNLKVIRQRGIIGKTIMEIGLDRIQDVKVYFGIFGRIFEFGTLEVESAGTLGRTVFRGIPSPKHVKNLINKEIKTQKLRDP